MATAYNPITLSQEYGIDGATLAALGMLNPTIAIDTLLFIDPMLLKQSAASKRGEPLSELEFIDGVIKPPTSQRK